MESGIILDHLRMTRFVALSLSWGSAVRQSIVAGSGVCREKTNEKDVLAVERLTLLLYANGMGRTRMSKLILLSSIYSRSYETNVFNIFLDGQL